MKTDELRGLIAKKRLSLTKVAKSIGVTPKTFYSKMNKGVFGSDEISIMVKELDIDNDTAMDIFFGQ